MSDIDDDNDGDGDDDDVIVIDNGSWMCKAGHAGDKTARAYVPTLVGRSADWARCGTSDGEDEWLVGEVADKKRYSCQLSCPLERGIVTDLEGLSRVWDRAVGRDLGTSFRNKCVLVTESPLNPRGNRERLSQLLFEHYQVNELCFASPGHLSLYSSGRVSGLTIDIGHGTSSLTAVYEGYPLTSATRRLDLAGMDITERLGHVMQSRGYSFSTPAQFLDLTSLKEASCVCRSDTDTGQWLKDVGQSYRLPDGETITLTSQERGQSAEILFDPKSIGMDSPGIPQLVEEVIEHCEVDLRRTLLKNVLLVGSTTMMLGLPERLTHTIRQQTIGDVDVCVVAPPERRKSAWLGGSVMASLSTSSKMFRSRADYEEHGPSILHSCL